MRERFQRCAYWPDCEIHEGVRLMVDVDTHERHQMYRKSRDGMTTGQIGAEHNLDYRQIYRVVHAIETFQKVSKRS